MHSQFHVSVSTICKMVEKVRSKAHGFGRGLECHESRANKSEEENPVVVKVLDSVEVSTGKISVAASAVQKYVIGVCTLFCFIPVEPWRSSSSGEQFQLAPLWKRIIHYSLASFYASFTMYKLAVTVYLLIYTELKVVFFMCLCSLFVLLLSTVAAGTGICWRPREALDLLASRESLRKHMQVRIELVSDVRFCLKLIGACCLAHCAALNAAAFSVVFDDLPVCVLPILTWLGMIPESTLPPIVWQIGFYPLEVLSLLPPMVAAAFICYMFLLGMGVLQSYGDHLRSELHGIIQ